MKGYGAGGGVPFPRGQAHGPAPSIPARSVGSRRSPGGGEGVPPSRAAVFSLANRPVPETLPGGGRNERTGHRRGGGLRKKTESFENVKDRVNMVTIGNNCTKSTLSSKHRALPKALKRRASLGAPPSALRPLSPDHRKQEAPPARSHQSVRARERAAAGCV